MSDADLQARVDELEKLLDDARQQIEELTPSSKDIVLEVVYLNESEDRVPYGIRPLMELEKWQRIADRGQAESMAYLAWWALDRPEMNGNAAPGADKAEKAFLKWCDTVRSVDAVAGNSDPTQPAVGTE